MTMGDGLGLESGLRLIGSRRGRRGRMGISSRAPDGAETVSSSTITSKPSSASTCAAFSAADASSFASRLVVEALRTCASYNLTSFQRPRRYHSGRKGLRGRRNTVRANWVCGVENGCVFFAVKGHIIG
jgi:hypothetical protein